MIELNEEVLMDLGLELDILEEATRRTKVIIIKGNPKYIDLNPHADKFYNELKQKFVANGYYVKFDNGEPFTLPDTNASIWIGHSRGTDRLRFAPSGIATIKLHTLSNDGDSKDHYVLSKEDIKTLHNLGLNESTILEEAKTSFFDKFNKRSLTREESSQLKIPKKDLHCSVMFFSPKSSRTKEKGGYIAYTHRSSSGFYDKPGDIPIDKLKFVSSTG